MILFSAYPAGSISPTFGPQYAARYYQPIYGPVLPQHQGSEGQPVINVPATSNQSENTNKDSNSNNDAEELSELVQKLNVDGGSDKDSSAEGGDKK